MIEEQPDGVELVVFEPLHVPSDWVLIKPERRTGAVFRSDPVDTLDVKWTLWVDAIAHIQDAA